MIIVQNLDKDIVGMFTTLKGFLRMYHGRGASEGSYNYLRAMLSTNTMPVKYKKLLITRGKPEAGTYNMVAYVPIKDEVEDYNDDEIIFKM